MIVEELIPEALGDIELMWVPILRENLLDVVLVHAEVHEVHLSTRLADKSAIGDISVRRLPLIAVDAVSVELVIGDQCHHKRAKLVSLGLLHELEVGGRGDLRSRHRCGGVGVGRCRLLALLLPLQVFSRHELDTLESIIVFFVLIIHFLNIIINTMIGRPSI